MSLPNDCRFRTNVFVGKDVDFSGVNLSAPASSLNSASGAKKARQRKLGLLADLKEWQWLQRLNGAFGKGQRS
jgi:hypothetical protein